VALPQFDGAPDENGCGMFEFHPLPKQNRALSDAMSTSRRAGDEACVRSLRDPLRLRGGARNR
jgi:hypothetical protein